MITVHDSSCHAIQTVQSTLRYRTVVDRAIYNFHGFCTDSTAVAAAGAADVAGRQRVPWEEPQIRAPAALPVAAGPPDHGDAAAARFGPVGQLSGQLH